MNSNRPQIENENEDRGSRTAEVDFQRSGYSQPAQHPTNPLATASVTIASIGLAICFFGVLWAGIEKQSRLSNLRRISEADHAVGDLRALADQANVGLSYLFQAMIIGLSGLIGGVFSLIGFALGLASLPYQQNRAGLAGIGLSLLGPLIVLLSFFLP